MSRRLSKAQEVVILLIVGVSIPAWGQNGLTIEPSVLDARFCVESHGNLSLRVRLDLLYRNMMTMGILIPNFAVVSGYSLFGNEKALLASRPEDRVRYKREHVLDSSKLDSSRPDPQLFGSIPAGGIAHRIQELAVFWQVPAGGSVPAQRDIYLTVDIDHWPDHQKRGEHLRKLWRKDGFLLIDTMTTSPVKLHLKPESPIGPCAGRVD